MKGPERFLVAAALAAGIAGCDDSVSTDNSSTGTKYEYTEGLDPGVTEYGGNPNCRVAFGLPGSATTQKGKTSWSSPDTGLGQVCSLDLEAPAEERIASLAWHVRNNFHGYNEEYPFYPGVSLVEVPAEIYAPLGPDECVVELGYYFNRALGVEGFQAVCAIPGRVNYGVGSHFFDPENPMPGKPEDPSGNFRCLIETRFDVNDCLRQFVADLPEDEPLPPALEPFSGDDPDDVCREDNPNRDEECI